jgi:hypothetical protein
MPNTLQELINDFNPTEVFYAFLPSVKDSKIIKILSYLNAFMGDSCVYAVPIPFTTEPMMSDDPNIFSCTIVKGKTLVVVDLSDDRLNAIVTGRILKRIANELICHVNFCISRNEEIRNDLEHGYCVLVLDDSIIP